MTPEALANLKELELPGRDGPKQKEVLIVWDIENCRIPVGVPAREVEKAISNAFLYLHRRKKAGFACSISEESLAALSSAYGRPDADYLKTHTKMVMAAGGGKYKSSDTKLLEEIESFVVRQSRDDRTAQSVLVVITGDGDFTKAILQAMDQGMDLEVLHPLGMTSRNLLDTIEGRRNVWHHDWLEFLEFWLRNHNKCAGLPARLELPRKAANEQQQGPPSGAGSSRDAGGQFAPKNEGPHRGNSVPRDGGAAAAGPQRGPINRSAAKPSGQKANSKPQQDTAAASLCLDSLPVVKQAPDPRSAQAACCNWLLQHKRENTELYQEMHAIANASDCKLTVGNELQSTGELTVACSSGAYVARKQAAQSVRDRVRNFLSTELTRSPYPSNRLTLQGLQSFLQARSVSPAGAETSGRADMLLRVNAILLADVALGLPATITSHGVKLVAVDPEGTRSLGTNLGRQAVREAMMKQLTVSQLKALLSARKVATISGLEKVDLAVMLAKSLAL